MQNEKDYDFLKRMAVIHKPNRRDASLKPGANETEIDDSWEIAVLRTAGKLVMRAAQDFQDYLLVSMGVSVKLTLLDKAEPAAKRLLMLAGGTTKTSKRGAFEFTVGDGILLRGAEERGVLYGGIRFEDLMNYREAPFLAKGDFVREPLARMRSIHSGCSIDDFPDWQLNAILHAGFTAIDIFIEAQDKTTMGYCNINDVIERALSYGLDTVLYNYMPCYKHPDDPDAEEFFDNVYGVLRNYPNVSAVHVVGESLEFPSKDPHTTGKRWKDSVIDGIPSVKPSPGWYPCCDYPAYITRIRKAIDKVNPNIELIFNTYNSGWASVEEREKFLAQMPKNITIQTTFDIFKMIEHKGLKCPVMDYSGASENPGFYFESEARIAHKNGMKVRATTNMGGLSWDFGCVPYEPIPQRWMNRMINVKKFLFECGLDSFYETHHYGWWPNVANDLAKEIFFTDGCQDLYKVLRNVAKRDYGEEVAEGVVEVWQDWSDAMDNYVASNEDQYGPWRVGPAYPLIFQPNLTRTMSSKEIKFPTAPHAHFGYCIIKTEYKPYENKDQSPAPLRYPVDIELLNTMLEIWGNALSKLQALLPKMKGSKRENGNRLFALGKFIRNSILTTLHTKHWWLTNIRLQASATREEMLKCMDKLQAIADEERKNVQDTFDVVAYDSRLGWEPSMEYVCNPWHLDWKLRQMDSMQLEMDAYRKMINL